MAEKTTIEVSSETWGRLNRRKSQGQSFDDVLVDILDTYERHLPRIELDGRHELDEEHVNPEDLPPISAEGNNQYDQSASDNGG